MEASTVYIIAISCLASAIFGALIASVLLNARFKAQGAIWSERTLWLEERQNELKEALGTRSAEFQKLSDEKNGLEREYARLETLNREFGARLEQQKQEWENSETKLQERFENLANKILEDKGQRFSEQSKKQLGDLLSPLSEKILLFEKQVQDTQKEQIGLHAQLREQLKTLREQNTRISQEAENLTRALKGDRKVQGNWGELVLEKVLEKSGLEKNREYSVQQGFRDDHGRLQLPDVIIHLPDGKKMVIDSKVSLSAYERLVNAPEEAERAAAAKEHLDAVKRHLQQLSAKSYEDIYSMESPDFVLMFIPLEPAFAAALELEPMLFNQAFERNIVMVTPTTLLATLKTIDSMWTNEKQRKNAIEIATVAGSMYDKFVNFCESLEQVGRRLDNTRQEYDTAMSRLREGRGNLIHSAERLKKLGARTKKSLPDSILGDHNDNPEPDQ